MTDGAAYVSVSMAVGAIYIWSYVYVIMKVSAEKSTRGERLDTHHSVVSVRPSVATSDSKEPLLISKVGGTVSMLEKIKTGAFGLVRRIRGINLQHLFAPTTIGSVIGFVVGVVPLLKMLLVGNSAPLRIIFSASEILGGATVPCVTLIVGANLVKGLRRSG
uniref:Uncharacterized protein n=2 Tax=Chenopodium quinoa TaxID=63459 RepID=A0A803NDE7_CHEQI